MTTYCSPCIADLALVREAATTVAGTSSCMAHAVLLTHSTDDPGRRRQRLDALRDLAAGKAEHADPAEQARLELLVQEYGLAGAMDMGGPSRRSGQQQRPIRQGQPGGQHGQHGQHGQQQQPAAGDEARRPKSRRGRQRPGDRPEGAEESRPEGAREGAREDARDGGRRGGRAGAETASLIVAPGQDGDGPPAPAPNAASNDGSSNTPAPSAPVGDGAPTAPAPTAPAPTAPAPSSAGDSAPSSGAAPTESRPTTGSGAQGAVPPSSSSDA